MKYLLVMKNGDVIYTKFYDYEHHYTDKISIVIDLHSNTYSKNGISFNLIKTTYNVHR